MRSFIRVNHKIRVPNVRCIKQDGTQAGVIPTRDALRIAMEQNLDLVEISPNAEPPVCKIMDFGKYRYEENQRQKEARKHQHVTVIKEIKFHANVGDHDYQTKLTHIKDFLAEGDKVKVSLTFRGRENVHKELGFQLITRAIKDCEDAGSPETSVRQFGSSIVVILNPKVHK